MTFIIQEYSFQRVDQGNLVQSLVSNEWKKMSKAAFNPSFPTPRLCDPGEDVWVASAARAPHAPLLHWAEKLSLGHLTTDALS